MSRFRKRNFQRGEMGNNHPVSRALLASQRRELGGGSTATAITRAAWLGASNNDNDSHIRCGPATTTHG